MTTNNTAAKMKQTILLVTATATFWGTIHDAAENITASWIGLKLAVSYKVGGVAVTGYVTPTATTSPAQLKAALKA